MPPNRFSRFKLTQGRIQSDTTLMLSDREPYTFRDFGDNVRHTVVAGDTLWTLAGKRFRTSSVTRPARYWWAIADFQPAGDNNEMGPRANHPPIFDPTIRLCPGLTLHIPSLRTLFEEILSDHRREEFL